MARFGDKPDIELTGILEGNTPKAFIFMPDFGEEEKVFVPKSQAEWIPDLDSHERRGIMVVRAWLAEKNGWDKA